MADTGSGPEGIIERRGLEQISDRTALQPIARKVLAGHPDEVQAYLAGKQKLLVFFIGQLMKETGGKANPQIGRELFLQLLEEKAH